MINITDRHNCCGCAACVQKCPKKCVSLVEDKEGFLYPCVDEEMCVGCGLCEVVCPELNPYDKRIPLKTLAAINKDESIRLQSSSGGIFTLLAEKFIDEGGVVFGARFDDKWQVVIDSSGTKEGLSAFRGSKYVQSRTEDTYFRCEQLLKENRKVLYSGTPCQIAGLKHFLHKEYDNLLTVDIICHGVPSPKVWKMYLEEVSKNAVVGSVQMRDKVNGCVDYHLTVKGHNNVSIMSEPNGKNLYMRAFLQNMIIRPSCYRCKARELRSGSDVTLGDYWGIDNVRPEMNDNKGVSILLVNTPKAKKLLESIDFKFEETTFEEGYKNNPVIFQSPKPWYRRKQFFDNLDISNSVCDNIRKCLKRTLIMKVNDKYYKFKVLLRNRN